MLDLKKARSAMAHRVSTTRAKQTKSLGRMWFGILTACSAAMGAILFVINAAGMFVPLRSPDINGYRDFAGGETMAFDVAIDRLDKLADSSVPSIQLVTEATRVFHAGIAHVSSVDIKSHGLEHYRMRVPVSENWILFALSYLKPDTYMDYEFCSYRRALERGTGRCGQQSMALVSFLDEQGIETGIISLDGHAVATAKVNETEWYILDADYGGVIPFGIRVAEQHPESVLPYYWSPAASENSIHELYAPENRVKYGGPEVRYGRACPIEYAAYVLKWVIPAVLFLPFFSLFVFGVTARRNASAATLNSERM